MTSRVKKDLDRFTPEGGSGATAAVKKYNRNIKGAKQEKNKVSLYFLSPPPGRQNFACTAHMPTTQSFFSPAANKKNSKLPLQSPKII